MTTEITLSAEYENTLGQMEREGISLSISRKGDIMPEWCPAQPDRFDSLSQAKEFLSGISGKAWNYETDKVRREENLLINADSIRICVEEWKTDEDGNPDQLTSTDIYTVEEFLELKGIEA